MKRMVVVVLVLGACGKFGGGGGPVFLEQKTTEAGLQLQLADPSGVVHATDNLTNVPTPMAAGEDCIAKPIATRAWSTGVASACSSSWAGRWPRSACRRRVSTGSTRCTDDQSRTPPVGTPASGAGGGGSGAALPCSGSTGSAVPSGATGRSPAGGTGGNEPGTTPAGPARS